MTDLEPNLCIKESEISAFIPDLLQHPPKVTTLFHPPIHFSFSEPKQPNPSSHHPQTTMPNSVYCNVGGCENDKVFSDNKQHQYCSTHKCADSSCGQRNTAGSSYCGAHKKQ
ncbi:hypothetical protein QBC32DRAFT_36310 [Pseudoneurospora amorphoporcata]|uniref:Uncharacterized protein n=1 Tax=Pseudoneurospora amorphoporcata TaxID=241081 RepID=A0AAN6NP47_9PEZI|nr:hypothetical protein QBC32DRAFT_36310 [Pseudoneurospora amorphoporcata]